MRYDATGRPLDALNELMEQLARGEVADTWRAAHAPDGDLAAVWRDCALYGAMVSVLQCAAWLTAERLGAVLAAAAAAGAPPLFAFDAARDVALQRSTFVALETLDRTLFRLSFADQARFHLALCDAFRRVAPAPPRLGELAAMARRHRAPGER